MALTSVLALAACGFSQEQIAQHDADFAGCERVDTNKMHLVYKCPANMERFTEIMKQEPNVMFLVNGALAWDEINADKEHVYVEVVGRGDNTCEENFHYRTMVKPADFVTKEYYAVFSCKTVKEVKAEGTETEETMK